MCTFNQLVKYQVKYMNLYIDLLVDEILKLWVGITMYEISRPIGQRRFQFHVFFTWTIHDAPGIKHFYGM